MSKYWKNKEQVSWTSDISRYEYLSKLKAQSTDMFIQEHCDVMMKRIKDKYPGKEKYFEPIK